jgi:hypothetical protein
MVVFCTHRRFIARRPLGLAGFFVGKPSCGGCLRAYASWTLAFSINVPSTSRDITGVRGYAAPDNSKARWAKFNRSGEPLALRHLSMSLTGS